MVLHRESALLAISLEDRSLEIMDIITRNVVRKFFDIHLDLVTDMTFSSDARWIITSSLDKTIKVWHVPTGNLIDHIAFSSKFQSHFILLIFSCWTLATAALRTDFV